MGSITRPSMSQHSSRSPLQLSKHSCSSSVLSPSNSLDTFPHSLRLASQLTVSPSTPSPGNVWGDLKLHVEGLFIRSASWALDFLISRPFTSPISSQTLTPLAHSQLPCPHQSLFSQSVRPESSLPCPARPTCLTPGPLLSIPSQPNVESQDSGVLPPRPRHTIIAFPPHQNTLYMVPT